MANTLEFWFEFGSTYSYPAAERVQRLAACGAARVRWRPFLLGPLFKVQGWNDSPFNVYPSKGRYMWQDVAQRCRRLGLPWKMPSSFPRNGLLAARVCTALGPEHPILPKLVCRLYRENFALDRDIATPETVADALAQVGLDAKHCLDRANTPEAKLALRSAGDEALAHGIFGAPSFIAGDQLFWGEDRLDLALDHVDVPCQVTDLRMRPFQLSDKPALIDLWRKTGLVTGNKDPEADIAQKRAAQPGLFLVAIRDDRLAGSCMAGFDGHRGWLHLLAIDPAQTHGGIGTALVRAAEARLAALGCRKVNLQVREHNHATLRFYEHLAYKQEGRHSLGKRLKGPP